MRVYTPKQDTFIGEIRECLYFFLPRHRQNFLTARTQSLATHVARIAHLRVDNPELIAATKIDIVTEYLDLVDRKFSVILQFHALLAIMLSILFGTLEGRLIFDVFLTTTTVLFGLLWLLTVLLSLRAVGRLYLGNMTNINCPTEAADQQCVDLTQCLLRRLARYRLAVAYALCNSAVLSILLVLATVQLLSS